MTFVVDGCEYFVALFNMQRKWSQIRDDVICDELTPFPTDFTTLVTFF